MKHMLQNIRLGMDFFYYLNIMPSTNILIEIVCRFDPNPIIKEYLYIYYFQKLLNQEITL